MAGILNVNNTHNIDLKKIHKKLSFDIGESFSAKIVDLEKLTGDVVLKLLDGWQFSAKLDNPLEFIQNKLMRFEVEGYENGNLVLKVLGQNQQETDETLETFLKNQGISVKNEDTEILEKMLKHNMPLTKENISKVKTLLYFKEKIQLNSFEEGEFIEKYLKNSNMDLNLDNTTKIKNILKGAFDEFKNLDSEDIFTFLENNIEFTESNIKSFNKINKQFNTIYDDIINTKTEFEIIENTNIRESEINNQIKNLDNSKNVDIKNFTNIIKDDIHKNPLKQNTYIENIYNSDSNELSGKDILKKLLNNENNKNSEFKSIEENIDKDTENNIEKLNIKEIDIKKFEKNDSIHDKINNKLIETSDKVKEQIDIKINEIKNVIKHFIDDSNGKSSSTDKIMQLFQNKINDFKVFNSISNQYYYLDVPVNINENKYPCKLIIKDDRKKGKKIDSTNIKFVVCIKTINLGVVDSYIKVRNENLNIDIKCEKEWVKFLNSKIENVIDKLNGIGYSANIKVKEKQEEVSLSYCRDFFKDKDFTRINSRV